MLFKCEDVNSAAHSLLKEGQDLVTCLCIAGPQIAAELFEDARRCKRAYLCNLDIE